MNYFHAYYKNLSLTLLFIFSCFPVFSQTPNDVLLDYIKEEFTEGSKEYDLFLERHVNAIKKGEVDIDAAYNIANYFTKLIVQAGYIDEGGDELKKIVAETLQIAVAGGHKQAIVELANLHLFGWHVEKDFKGFDKYMRLAAEKDMVEGYEYLGLQYNWEKEKSKKLEAMKYLKKASSMGGMKARRVLGVAYLDGDIGANKDSKLGLRLLKESADSGDEKALEEICQRFSFHDEVRDLNSAIQYCPITATKGSIFSQYSLGLSYAMLNDNVSCFAWSKIALLNKEGLSKPPFNDGQFESMVQDLHDGCLKYMTKSELRRAQDLIKEIF